MTEKEWAFVDQCRRLTNQLECDLLRQRCQLNGFELETTGGSLRLIIDFKVNDNNDDWERFK